jgi:4-aminobutyrate aminotransferase / (S)-3-amino-2-methylpropionate transaminase / 5-aminovalerate transaminase
MAQSGALTKAVSLRTAIPGPKSREWMARRDTSVARGVAHATPVFIAAGDGAVLEDVDGNRYLDFAGGIGCLNVGHAAPELRDAIREQAGRSLHNCFQVTPNDSYIRVAEELNRRSPGNAPKKTLLVNSGAEAIENAVKMARAHTGRPAVLAFDHAFHGRTLLGMTLTGKNYPYKAGFGPFAPEVYRLPFPYAYRCRHESESTCAACRGDDIERAFDTAVASDSVAAIVFEPVLGEGGFVPMPRAFAERLQSICAARGIVLIADEIQTGYGRTGRFFASETLGIQPDLVVAGKSIAGGLPLASVTGRADIVDAAGPGGLGGTYAGNPVTCAAALAVLEIYDREQLVTRAARLGAQFESLTREWSGRYPVIGDIRGLGIMRGIELVVDRTNKIPAREQTSAVVSECLTRGLIVLSCGTYGNVIRLLVPLVITDDQFVEGIGILQEALAAVSGQF